jgi:hypothetical protein
MGFGIDTIAEVATIGAAVAGVASAGVGAVGAMNSANAQRQAANYQAEVAKNNAIIAGQNAEAATQAGAEKATEASLRSRETVGAAMAGAAANNLDIGSGSAADVITSQREVGTLGTEQTVNNAALQAYGFRSQQTGFTATSGLDTAEAKSAAAAGPLAAGGDLLSGVSSVGANYARYQLKAKDSSGSSGANPGAFGALDGQGLY